MKTKKFFIVLLVVLSLTAALVLSGCNLIPGSDSDNQGSNFNLVGTWVTVPPDESVLIRIIFRENATFRLTWECNCCGEWEVWYPDVGMYDIKGNTIIMTVLGDRIETHTMRFNVINNNTIRFIFIKDASLYCECCSGLFFSNFSRIN